MNALEFSELLVASKGETLVFGDLITDGVDTFCYLKAKTLKWANTRPSGEHARLRLRAPADTFRSTLYSTAVVLRHESTSLSHFSARLLNLQ
ncbi:hypothetical protein AAC387_Pa02g2499 [Persea americana]